MWNLLLHMVFDTISFGYLSVRKDYHMNTHNQKHLTVSDRLYIEQELLALFVIISSLHLCQFFYIKGHHLIRMPFKNQQLL